MVQKQPYRCLSVLGNKLRTDILILLKEKPLTVSQISTKLKKEQSVVSHALAELKHCHFVNNKRKGKEREYFIDSDILIEAQHKPLFETIEAHVKKYCGPDCK